MTEQMGTASARPLRERSLLQFLLLFVLLFAIHRYFATITQTLLLLYATAALGVVFNSVIGRVPLRRSWASALLGLLIVGVLAVAIWFLGRMLVAQLHALVENLPSILSEVEQWLTEVGARVGIPLRRAVTQAVQGAGALLSGGDVVAGARTALDIILGPLIILAGALFAVGKPWAGLISPMLAAVPPGRRAQMERAMRLLGTRLLGWIQGQLLAMLAVGTLALVAYVIIGVPYALLLAFVAGLTEFIPLVGPWIGGIAAVIVAAVDEPMKGAWTALALFIIQMLENAIVTPLAMADRARVHPFITLFALVFFGGMFGFLGVLLAIPLVLLIWTVLQVFWVEAIA